MPESEATKIAVTQSQVESIKKEDLPRLTSSVQELGSKFDVWTAKKEKEFSDTYLTKEEFKPYKRILGLLATIAVTTLAIAVLNLVVNQRQDRVIPPTVSKPSPATGSGAAASASGSVPAGGQSGGTGTTASDESDQVTSSLPVDTGILSGTGLAVPDATRFLGLPVGKIL